MSHSLLVRDRVLGIFAAIETETDDPEYDQKPENSDSFPRDSKAPAKLSARGCSWNILNDARSGAGPAGRFHVLMRAPPPEAELSRFQSLQRHR